jgi:RNA polymerase sigma-70 factor (ECF subfamily)
MPSQDDELLVIRCQLGEPEALDALVLRWHTPLSRYITGLLPSDNLADDVTQEVWLGILRGLSRLREPAAFAPWIFGIARRTVMTRLRTRYAAALEVQVDSLDTLEGPDAVDPGADDTFDWTRVEQQLSRLQVIDREVLVLFYLKEMSLQDIAAVLVVPPGTVKSRLHRARKQLRAWLEESA